MEYSGAQPRLFSKTLEVRTSNIAKSLNDLIIREKVHPASVDFDILRVKTFIKEPNRDEYSPLDKENLEKLRNESFLLEPQLQILQEYLVKFKPLEPQPFKLKIAIASDKHRSLATATIKAGSLIRPIKELKQHLFLYFNKLKLRNNMLIYLLDEPLRVAVGKLADMASNEPLAQDFVVPLANWPHVIDTINDEIIYHYIDKNRQDEDAKQINYADRGFISAVSAGEVLIEYIEAKAGKAGRGFNGKFVDVPDPVVDNYPDFGVDASTIEVKSENGKKFFVAKDDGYVKFDNGVLAIDKTMSVGGISLKTTGNVRAGTDKNVKIEVDGKDPSEEVIGADMVVEASEVRANGSVGGGAKIKAETVVITGQTHQTSEIYAKNIEVNILRGLAVGEEVRIKTLEGGRARGKNITIDQAVGGEVSACTVEVGNLRGRSKISATKTITIKQITKGENKLIIDPMANDEFAKEIEEIYKAVDLIKKEIEQIKKAMEQNSAYIRKNQDGFNQVQIKISEDKKEGRPPSEAFIRMAREFLTAMKKEESFVNTIDELEKQIVVKKSEIEKFDKMVLDATVINEAVNWYGFNEIRFKLPVFGKEFVHNISDGERILRIRLELNELGEYEVMTVHG